MEEANLKVGDIVFSADAIAVDRYGPGPFRIREAKDVNVIIEHLDGTDVLCRGGVHFGAYATRFRRDFFLEQVFINGTRKTI